MRVVHGGNALRVAREKGWDWRDIADFSASINPLGPPAGVFDAIRNALDRIAHYPEAEPTTLREALGELWAVDPDRILLGNGATELLHWFARVVPQERVTLAVPVTAVPVCTVSVTTAAGAASWACAGRRAMAARASASRTAASALAGRRTRRREGSGRAQAVADALRAGRV